MSDRYRDRHDSRYDEYNEYDYGSSRRRQSSYRDSSYGYDDDYAADTRQSRRSSSRQSSGYSTSDYPADPYRSGSSSSRRGTQGSDAQYRSKSYSASGSRADDASAYRRSAYGSGASRSSRTSSREASDYGRSYSDDRGYDSYSGGRTTRRSARSAADGTTQQVRTTGSGHSASRTSSQQPYSRQSGQYTSQGAHRSATAQQPSSGRRAAATQTRSSRPTRSAGAAAGASYDARGQYDVQDDYADDASYAGDYAPKRSNLKRNVAIAAVVVVALVLVGVGVAFAYVNSISQNLREGLDEQTVEALTPTSVADEPFYMLLMGTDGSADRYESDDFGEEPRSDSMMLARVDPVNKKVSLISIHRDTMVDLGEYGEQKINAAYQLNGAAGAIEAVSKMAGVDISHYASVDFDGFEAIVDSLGGIEVEVPMEIDDEMAGGHLDAGYQTLDGWQALILCRARHAYDDVANDGDVMRAANQRMVISAIAKKVLSSDVMTIANTVQAMSKYVTTDLSITDIIGLAQLMQGIDPAADIYTAMEPTESAYIDETWYEFLDEDEWKKMISRMDQGLPPTDKNEIDDATGTILSTAGTDAPTV